MKEFVEGRTRWLRVTLSWIYIAIYAIAGVAFWRGIWTLMTRDIGLGTIQLLVILVTGLVLTLVMKVMKQLKKLISNNTDHCRLVNHYSPLQLF